MNSIKAKQTRAITRMIGYFRMITWTTFGLMKNQRNDIQVI